MSKQTTSNWGLELQKIFNTSIFASFLFLQACGGEDVNLTRSMNKKIPAKLDATNVIVVAHPDDWQLFLGEFAYDMIQSSTTKVVIIQTNAGDAGKTESFWKARELASLASVRSVLGYPLIEGDASEVSETLTLAGKNIQHNTLRNVSIYSLRLPDGFPKGGGSGLGGFQSMKKLSEGEISSITSIDDANTFSWEDLHSVINAIVEREYTTRTDPIRFLTLDPGKQPKATHSDHDITQEIGRNVFHNFASENCRYLAFQDYRIKDKKKNIGSSESAKKSLLFTAYDTVMYKQEGTCNLCEPSYYQWLLRSYYREFNC